VKIGAPEQVELSGPKSRKVIVPLGFDPFARVAVSDVTSPRVIAGASARVVSVGVIDGAAVGVGVGVEVAVAVGLDVAVGVGEVAGVIVIVSLASPQREATTVLFVSPPYVATQR
jgi:hypothetical protein